tara:strand:+ start:159 stop:566 length:408 start_codon:yes stop_codon:yes gene_type:complete
VTEIRKFIIDGKEVTARIDRSGNALKIAFGDKVHEVSIHDQVREKKHKKTRKKRSNLGGGTGSVVSTIPGKVISLDVNVGDIVAVGQTLLILEAMKMQNEVCSKTDGIVKDIFVKEGDNVDAGAELVFITEDAHG